MNYSKLDQLSREKKLTTTQLNKKVNRELEKLWIKEDINVCEWPICSAMNLSNAHRHPRDWYKGKDPQLLWALEQVIRLCPKHHHQMDDRSQTTEEQKEAIFIIARGI